MSCSDYANGTAMNKGLDLHEQLVVVSGGNGALGKTICSRLTELGATVVSVDVAKTQQLAGEGPALCYQADVSDVAQIEAMLDSLGEQLGRLPSTVCCHAGIVSAHAILDLQLEDFDEVMRVNVRGAFVLAQATAKRWVRAGTRGHLIFTSSWVQDYPWPEIAAYCASKAALHSLMRSFAKELAPFGVRANAVLPGIVDSGMARKQWDEDPSYRHRAEQVIALGELQSTLSVADAFAFLCSPLASYMTGATLRVDGGCSLGIV